MGPILRQLLLSILSIVVGLGLSAAIGLAVGYFLGGMPGIIAFFVSFVVLWITWSRTNMDQAMTYGARWADPSFRRGYKSSTHDDRPE